MQGLSSYGALEQGKFVVSFSYPQKNITQPIFIVDKNMKIGNYPFGGPSEISEIKMLAKFSCCTV